MQAVLNGHVLAKSDETAEGAGLYDVVIDGERADRAAWSYESPRPALQHLAGRFGFWGKVAVL